jgi:hypothetical protein
MHWRFVPATQTERRGCRLSMFRTGVTTKNDGLTRDTPVQSGRRIELLRRVAGLDFALGTRTTRRRCRVRCSRGWTQSARETSHRAGISEGSSGNVVIGFVNAGAPFLIREPILRSARRRSNIPPHPA